MDTAACVRNGLGGTKVADAHKAIVTEKKIVSFDVTVDNPPLVEVAQAACSVPQEPSDFMA